MIRYLIKFSKENSIKFIGHLDLMRTIQRMIRRSQLPVQYSNGFNPRINMSIAQPLPVGTYSCGEYMDICFKNEVDENEIKSRLNQNAPLGIKIYDVIRIKDIVGQKAFKSMAEVYAAKYVIKMKYIDTSTLEVDMKNIIKREQWKTLKKTKRGEAEINIKKFVKKFTYKVERNLLVMNILISCGSRNNLSAGLLSDYIQKNTSFSDKNAFVDIMREEMYGIYNENIVPLTDEVKFWNTYL